MAERKAVTATRSRSLLDTDAHIHSSFTSEVAFTATLRTANPTNCYRAAIARDATSMHLLPLRYGSIAKSSIIAGPRRSSACSGKLTNWRQCHYCHLTSVGSSRTSPMLSHMLLGFSAKPFLNDRFDAIKRYGVLGVGHMHVEPAPRAHAHGTGSTNICSWSRSPEISQAYIHARRGGSTSIC